MRNRIKVFGSIVIATAIALTAFGCGSGVAGFNAGLPVDMVKIEGGTFTMGSPKDEHGRTSDEIQHQVTLSGFYIGKYEVTQKQYEAVMDYNPSYFKGANLPVEKVSWYNAVEFCNKLSKKEGREPVYTMTDVERNGSNISEAKVTADWSKNGYRLPTSAEWEYACRAGTTTAFNTGNNITTEQANFGKEGVSIFEEAAGKKTRTTPVGTFKPNAWGLYDMHGNVYEWCWDWGQNSFYKVSLYEDIYDKDYYTDKARTDPKGPKLILAPLGDSYGRDREESGLLERVTRGGSWRSKESEYLRSASMIPAGQRYGEYDCGFRVARNL